MRFDMARALVVRAKQRAEWIGDDHGDPYEEALNSGKISVEMRLALKEILDHLRSALDYAAREVCERVSPGTSNTSIYFPIVARGFQPKDFPSRVGKLMPGVLAARPDIASLLASFQHFSAPSNGWLPDLATLANETKHETLSVHEVAGLPFEMKVAADGGYEVTAYKADGTPYFPMVLARLSGVPDEIRPGEPYSGTVHYIRIDPIDQELLTFLRSAIDGTNFIIDAIEAHL